MPPEFSTRALTPRSDLAPCERRLANEPPMGWRRPSRAPKWMQGKVQQASGRGKKRRSKRESSHGDPGGNRGKISGKDRHGEIGDGAVARSWPSGSARASAFVARSHRRTARDGRLHRGNGGDVQVADTRQGQFQGPAGSDREERSAEPAADGDQCQTSGARPRREPGRTGAG